MKALPSICAMTIIFGVMMVASALYRPSDAFQLVMLICGTISFTGMCVVKAIAEQNK